MDIDQLQQAVEIALKTTDSQLRQQALEYCESVRTSTDGWKYALQILSLPNVSQDMVFFAYQVLETQLSLLETDTIDTAVREKMWNHYASFVTTNQVPHLKAKLASLMGILFLKCYESKWPSLIKDLRGFNTPVAAEMYGRVLYVIHEEIGDTLILHDAETMKKTNTLKDLIRERDMISMIDSWVEALENWSPNDAQSVNIIDQTLQVIGGFVSWMDIAALLGNGKMIPLILRQFETPALRPAASDTIFEIVSKKMPAANKLELLMLLDVVNLVKIQNFDDPEYRQRFARTLNGLMNELLIVLNNTEDVQIATKAEALLVDVVPFVVQFLKDQVEVATQIIPAINEYLQWVRKEAKKQQNAFDTSNLTKNSYGQAIDFPPDHTFIPDSRRALVKHLFESVIERSLFDDETEWEAEDDEFIELRHKLKVLQDQCSSIDIDLFVDEIASFVKARFDNPPTKWQEAELALYELGILSETVKTLKTPRGTESRPQQVLLHLFVAMVDSSIVSINHPSIQEMYMELVYRHSQYPEKLERSPLLMKALETFISPLGVHNSNKTVRERSWYLFYKVFKNVRKQLSTDTTVARTISASLSPLLVIGDEPDETFEKKLNLFELCGMLFANNPDYDSSELTHNLLDGIFANLQKAIDVAKSDNAEAGQQRVNRTIMALGQVTGGMSEVAKREKFQNSPNAAEMQNASKVVIAVLEQLPTVKLVREACRFTFSRLVSLLGSHIIVEISQLINCLLNTCSMEELPEFLSFLGQLAHSFKNDEDMFTMFASLCTPLFERIFVFLTEADNEAQSGSTDSQVLRRELIRSYVSFLQALFNNHYGSMFLISTNHQTLENVMQSLFHYACNLKDVQSQKLAIVCLVKIVGVWGTGTVPEGEVGSGQSIPLFASPEIYSKLTELCWSFTTKPDYPLRDAQTRLVVLELGGLQKLLWEARGEWYSELLKNYLLEAGLSTELTVHYVSQLASSTAKDFKRCFYDFLMHQRGG